MGWFRKRIKVTPMRIKAGDTVVFTSPDPMSQAQALIAEAKDIRSGLVQAIDACARGEVDAGFGRELVAALSNLEAMSDV